MLGTLRLRRSGHVPEEVRQVLGETGGSTSPGQAAAPLNPAALLSAAIPTRPTRVLLTAGPLRETRLIDGFQGRHLNHPAMRPAPRSQLGVRATRCFVRIWCLALVCGASLPDRGLRGRHQRTPPAAAAFLTTSTEKSWTTHLSPAA